MIQSFFVVYHVHDFVFSLSMRMLLSRLLPLNENFLAAGYPKKTMSLFCCLSDAEMHREYANITGVLGPCLGNIDHRTRFCPETAERREVKRVLLCFKTTIFAGVRIASSQLSRMFRVIVYHDCSRTRFFFFKKK